MIKSLLVVTIATATLTGCTNLSTTSGDVFSDHQAKQAQAVSYGTVISVRPVTIQGGDKSNVMGAIGGAVLGGFLGNTIGGGRGQSLATAAGAVAGGMAGQGIQGKLNTTKGVQLEIRKDDGVTISVVQKQGKTQFSPGQRVLLAGSGNNVTVSPR
ncbi:MULTISPECIES: glycine zipper 2TM domain-containing protein [Candidatus Regiella]|uniref:Lipoprotein n=2 Tax=Candidatus Regiella insecticola TaxID=138073 RepID=A0A6L2ZRI0_9ENTR|nr:glycine zipper 2TM domain-containing protein [Candidatus Regiella insecticola]GFN47139.1 lipoprotein [Candidatus Regiella insecticola]